VDPLLIGATFALAMLALLLYGVFKIAPRSFTCRVTLLRWFSFEIEMEGKTR
jgi:hypothetical protein